MFPLEEPLFFHVVSFNSRSVLHTTKFSFFCQPAVLVSWCLRNRGHKKQTFLMYLSFLKSVSIVSPKSIFKWELVQPLLKPLCCCSKYYRLLHKLSPPPSVGFSCGKYILAIVYAFSISFSWGLPAILCTLPKYSAHDSLRISPTRVEVIILCACSAQERPHNTLWSIFYVPILANQPDHRQYFITHVDVFL